MNETPTRVHCLGYGQGTVLEYSGRLVKVLLDRTGDAEWFVTYEVADIASGQPLGDMTFPTDPRD